MNANAPRAKEIFGNALAMAAPQERGAYLDQACSGNVDLRAEVEQLLAASAAAGSFIERPLLQATEIRDESAVEGTVIGPYKLLQKIGEGGMGVVYMAEQTEPVERRVALKIIKPGMDTRQVIARFEAERQALAMMDHPNIAKVFDAGSTENGRPYFVMELVKGVPITSYCDEHHLTPKARLELFVPVCQAIQHAHQKGIIHRDLKPSNVLVSLYDGRPSPKVIDFGVAKAVGQPLTEKTLVTGFGNLVGTLEYMSPEQAEVNQLDIDTRSDIYSLGVLLYELLAGSTPFSRDTLQQAGMLEMLRVIREQEPSKPSTKLSTAEGLPTLAANRSTEPAKLTKLVRGELDWIVMKALEKDRNSRYATATGFAMDVQRYLADEPVEACPPSAAYRLRKFTRRNKRSLVTASVVGVALLFSVGSFGWMMRDRAARQMAVDREVLAAFEEAERLQEQAQWSEALSATKRAEGLLAGGAGDDLAERVRQLRKDLEMVLKLDNIRLFSSEWKDDAWDNEGADRDYAKAFADYGIDVAAAPKETSERIAARPGIAMVLLTALDDWALVRLRKGDRAGGLAQLDLAQANDPDRWRREVRDAWRRTDGQKLTALASSPEVLRQPPASIHLLSRALDDAGQLESAIEMLRMVQRQFPGDFWINYQLGSLLSSREPADQAEAISFYRAALAVRPQCSAILNDLGTALYEQNKLDEAEACYREALEIDPNHAWAHGNIGLLFLDQGKADEAIVWTRKAIELNQNNPNSHNTLGMALRRKGEVAAAIASYQRAIEINPRYANAHANLGRAFMDQAQFDDAIACLRKAIEFDAKHANAHNGMGTVFLKQNKLDNAIDWYRKAIAIDPEHGNAHYNMGRAHWQKGDVEAAIAWYRKAIVIAPKRSQPREGLALALGGLSWDLINRHDPKLRDPQGALEAIVEAVELAPQSGWVWQCAGWVHYRAGNWQASIEALEKSCALQAGGTGDAGQWIVLALAHAKLGEHGDLSVEEREHHNLKARRLYEEASKQIDDWWAARPGDDVGQAIWDFREEAAALLEWPAPAAPTLELPPGAISKATQIAELLRRRAALDERAAATPADRWERWQLATDRYQLSVALRDLEQLAEAESVCRQALDTFRTLADEDPREIQFDYDIGWTSHLLSDVLAMCDRFEEAEPLARESIARFQAVAEIGGDRPEYRDAIATAHDTLEHLLAKLNRPDEAAAAQREAQATRQAAEELRRTLPSPQALLDSARPYAETRDWRQAAAELNKGGEWQRSELFLCFSNALVRLLSGDVEGYARLTAVMPVLPSSKISRWSRLDFLRTCTLHPRGAADPATLIPLAQLAYDDDANNWSAQNLGMAHYRAGEFEAALQRMQEAQVLGEWFVFYPALAMTHHQLGHTEEARQWLEKADAAFRNFVPPAGERLKTLQDDPYWQDWAYFEVMLQEAAALIGRTEELTESELRTLLRRTPDSTILNRRLGLLLQNEDRLAEAEPFLFEVVRLAPDRYEPNAELVEVLRRQQKLAEAESFLLTAIQQDADQVWLHALHGGLLLEQQKFAAAELAWREILRIDPTNHDAHVWLGYCVRLQNRFADAETVLREAVRLKPDDTHARRELGAALLQQEQFAAAETELREALRLDPKSPGAPELLNQALMGQGKPAEVQPQMKRESEAAP